MFEECSEDINHDMKSNECKLGALEMRKQESNRLK